MAKEKNLGLGFILLFLPWFLVGGLVGIHSFYAGKIGKGFGQIALWLAFWVIWFGGTAFAAMGYASGFIFIMLSFLVGLAIFVWGVVDAIRMKSDLGL